MSTSMSVSMSMRDSHLLVVVCAQAAIEKYDGMDMGLGTKLDLQPL